MQKNGAVQLFGAVKLTGAITEGGTIRTKVADPRAPVDRHQGRSGHVGSGNSAEFVPEILATC
jgi:hypothetical protein